MLGNNLCKLFSTKPPPSKLSRRGGKKKNIKDPPPSSSSSCRKDDHQPQCPAVERLRTCPPKPAPLFPITDASRFKLRFWRYLTFFGAIPSVILALFIIIPRHQEENKKPRPEFKPMDYMYIRTKRYPWGDGNHSFFHNPEKNAIPPDGYEVPDPNAPENNE